MRKIYVDLIIAAVCLFLLLKFSKVFLILVGVLLVIWFFILSDKKKEEIKKKIADFHDR